HGRGGLLAGHILGPTGQTQLAHAHADGPGGHQHQRVPGVFQIAENFAQQLHPADIQPPPTVGQGRSADFDDNTHDDLLLKFVSAAAILWLLLCAETLREAFSAAAPLRRRTPKPLLEERWHAKRDGEVCRRAAAAARKRPLQTRSEEYTSELQSRFDLVCRLLLEKKKHNEEGHSPLRVTT